MIKYTRLLLPLGIVLLAIVVVAAGAPAGAQSLVLIVNDPDSPSGTFKHWIIFNIAPETAEIKENSVPEGAVQLKNDFGNANYGGPCPGTGTHRYFFKIFAFIMISPSAIIMLIIF